MPVVAGLACAGAGVDIAGAFCGVAAGAVCVDAGGAACGAAAGAVCAWAAIAANDRAAVTRKAIKQCDFEYTISSLVYE
jgi:hypothetical protein